jgi:HAD superfamily hydrolase (TIGR01484 family)
VRYLSLATDFDGTLAHDAVVDSDVWEAVDRLKSSGRKVLLVTGRQVNDLKRVCPDLSRFDHVVAENGGVLYHPSNDTRKLLAPAPPKELVKLLRDRGVKTIEEGETLVATFKPFETVALQVIRDLGLETKLVFNKDAVMMLNPQVSKATGLTAALNEMGLSAHNVVGVGDAENDHAFLDLCECSVAVDNALPMLKQHANLIMKGRQGRGVIELIDMMLKDDLRSQEAKLNRHHLPLGRPVGNAAGEVMFSPYGTVALVAGSSGGGKTTATLRLVERLVERGYQFVAFDPEGDYDTFEEAVILGGPHHRPEVDEVLQLLRDPKQNVIVNMLHVPLNDRPKFCASLLVHLQELRSRTGRPHWLIFDEAHHLFPVDWQPADVFLPEQLESALLITVEPRTLAPSILKHVNLAVTVGQEPDKTMLELSEVVGKTPKGKLPSRLEKRQAIVWRVGDEADRPVVVQMERGHTEHRRHVRKYAEGQMEPERSFYFRGPEGKLNLRAHNLMLFSEIAGGVDEGTWLHHLRQNDYSHWFENRIGDDEMAAEARAIEDDKQLTAEESCKQIRELVERRYTLPENPALPKATTVGG